MKKILKKVILVISSVSALSIVPIGIVSCSNNNTNSNKQESNNDVTKNNETNNVNNSNNQAKQNYIAYDALAQTITKNTNNDAWTYDSALNNWKNKWNNLINTTSNFQSVMQNNLLAYFNFLPTTGELFKSLPDQWTKVPWKINNESQDIYINPTYDIENLKINFINNNQIDLSYIQQTTLSYKIDNQIYNDATKITSKISLNNAVFSPILVNALMLVNQTNEVVYGGLYLSSALCSIQTNVSLNKQDANNKQITSLVSQINNIFSNFKNVVNKSETWKLNTIESSVTAYPFQTLVMASTYDHGINYGLINLSNSDDE